MHCKRMHGTSVVCMYEYTVLAKFSRILSLFWRSTSNLTTGCCCTGAEMLTEAPPPPTYDVLCVSCHKLQVTYHMSLPRLVFSFKIYNRFYYPHQSTDSVSPICGIIFNDTCPSTKRKTCIAKNVFE